MSKGKVMLRQVIKLMNYQKDSLENAQISTQHLLEGERKLNKKEESEERAIKLVKRERNLLSRLSRVQPSLSTGHIYKLFCFLGINGRAVEDPSFEESFFKTYFHGRAVQRVEIYENAILLQLASAQFTTEQLPVELLIETFKSKGCMKFYELAKKIQQILGIFQMMEGLDATAERQDSIKKWLDMLGDTMFVCTSGTRKTAISKRLLTYLGYDVEEFCLQAIKFKGIFTQLFSARSYFSGVMHILNLFKYTVQLATNHITFAQFKQLTTLHFSDFMYSKKDIKSYCDMSLELLNPSVLVHKIHKIHYQQKENGWRIELPALQAEKEQFRQNEYQTIRKVKNIPSCLLQQNNHMIAGYKMVDQAEERMQNHQ